MSKQPEEQQSCDKQEPVAHSDAYYMIDRFLQNNLNSDADYAEYSKALDSICTTPPQRTYPQAERAAWVGLTDEEISEFDTWHDNREEEVGWCNPSEIVAYIEAKLKEKNT